MDEKRVRAARWLIVIGPPLILILILVSGWSVVAAESQLGAESALMLYEIRLTDAEIGRLEVVVPSGFEYVGLEAASQVGVNPEILEDGARLVWNGPFPGGGAVRFWLAPLGSIVAPDTLTVVGVEVEAVRVKPVAPSPLGGRTGAPSGELAGTVTVSKTVEPEMIEPGDSLWVTYEVVFAHEAPEPVTLDRITDTLPADFVFGGMAYGSDVITAPLDAGNSQYVWESVTFSGTLTMRYNVRAVERSGEYQNSVVALAGGVQIGPVSATLSVAGHYQLTIPMVYKDLRVPMPMWQVIKSAEPVEVHAGESVDYRVEIRNVGDATGTVGTIWDFVPSEFSFVQMLPGSEVSEPPSMLNGWLEWWSEDDPWQIPPGENLVLLYQLEAGGAGAKTNTVEFYTIGGRLVGSATSTVSVLEGAPLPFEDDFANGVSPDWQPFLNWPGLSAGRWYWLGELGSWGIYNYDSLRVLPENTGYDLSIYNATGAQNWTNYRIETRMKDVKDHNLQRGLTGIWFRGTYQDSGLMDGRAIGGYYFYMKPEDDRLYLGRIRPADSAFHLWDSVASYYYPPRIGRAHWYDVIIEVRDARIQVWFGDEEDGIIKVFDWTDPQAAWPNGTVGFAEYYTASRYDFMRVLPLD